MKKILKPDEMERLVRISGRLFGICSTVFGALLLLLFVLAESAERIGQQSIPIAGYCLVSGLIMIVGGLFFIKIRKKSEEKSSENSPDNQKTADL